MRSSAKDTRKKKNVDWRGVKELIINDKIRIDNRIRSLE